MHTLPISILNRLRDTAEATMPDTCQVLDRTVTGADRHGKETVAYTAVGQVLPCGFRPPTSREVLSETVVADYVVRLPHDAPITRDDSLRLLTSHGETLNPPIDGDIIGEIEHGPSALVVKLKAVPYGN